MCARVYYLNSAPDHANLCMIPGRHVILIDALKEINKLMTPFPYFLDMDTYTPAQVLTLCDELSNSAAWTLSDQTQSSELEWAK